LLIAIILLTNSQLAHAATRPPQFRATWVGGTGTDSGACPITAPCKTFQYAFTQTLAGGTINVLSPGSFGPLDITKSVSIVADGVEALIQSPMSCPVGGHFAAICIS